MAQAGGPLNLAIFWPDGKHRSWSTVPAADRADILRMIDNDSDNEEIIDEYPHVTIGTIAAVRARLNR